MLQTADLAELTVVGSMLDAEGIPYAVLGEEAVRLGPLRALNPLFGMRLPTARLQVEAGRVEEVEGLLRELADDARDDPS